MPPVEATTDYAVCETGLEKCDKIKPYCYRCQQPHTECPEYTTIEHSNEPNRELRTLPSHPALVVPSQAAIREVSDSASLPPQVLGAKTSSEFGQSKWPTFSSPSNQLLQQHSSTSPDTSHESVVEILDPQVNTPDPHPTEDLVSDADIHLVSKRVTPDTENQDNMTTHDNGDLVGIISVIHRGLVLDKTAESNALPFVLQGYAAWINLLAFDPVKVTSSARDSIFSHFEDGDQARCIVALVANIGSRVGSGELRAGRPNRLTSMLQSAVRHRLRTVKSRPNAEIPELAKALDSAIQAMTIHFYTSSYSEAMALRQEAAPIFRQLCPEPPNVLLNLPSLLQHHYGCLRQYVATDIIFSVFTDMPGLFQYEVPVPRSQPSDTSSPVLSQPDDGIIQWLYGIPSLLIQWFAYMRAIRSDVLAPNKHTVASVERVIRELPPFIGPSSDRFVAIMRSVVQECWRQAAFIYLYMAVCEDPSNTPRVMEAFNRFIRLLKGTRPGRLPDEFLASPLTIISPAAQLKRDREVIRERILGNYRRGRTSRTNPNVLCAIEDYWARADAEGRPNIWSDITVSQRRVLGRSMTATIAKQ